MVGIDRNQNLSREPANPDFIEFVNDDLAEPGVMCRLIGKYAPKAIVHAAGPANVRNSFRNPSLDLQAQVMPWLTVLEALRLSGAPTAVVLCSSAAVYGNPDKLPVSEAAAYKPISPYGYHKVLKETMLQEYVALHSVKGSIARIFSTYGPGLRQLAVWEITRRMLAGEHKIDGTGRETRDFLYIGDVASALVQIAAASPHTCSVYNVGSGTETQIIELARLLGRELGLVNLKLCGDGSTGATIGKPARWCADTTALCELGAARPVSLEDGLRETVRWIKSV